MTFMIPMAAFSVCVCGWLLKIFFRIHFYTERYCDTLLAQLGVALIALTIILLVATIVVAVLVSLRHFKITIFLDVIKFSLVLSIIVIVAYVAYTTRTGEKAYRKWEHRVEKNLANCLANGNICQHDKNHKLKECCEEPQGCHGVTINTSLDCHQWNSFSTMCYTCNVCRRAVHRKLVENWNYLKNWTSIPLLTFSFVLVIGEFVYHAWMWYGHKNILQQQQQQAQQQ